MREIKSFFRMLKLTKPRWIKYWASMVILIALDIAIELLYALSSKYFVVSIQEKSLSMLKITTIMAIGVIVIKIISAVFSLNRMFAIRDIMLDIRFRLFKHMCNLDLEYYEKNHSGDTISRLINDVEPIKEVLTNTINDFIFSIFLIVANISLILYFDLFIGLVVIICSIVSSIANIYLTRKIRNLNGKIYENLSDMSQKVGDIISGFRILKIYPAKIVYHRFDEANEKSVGYNRKLAFENGVLNGFDFIIYILINVGVITLGVWLTLRGQAKLENVVAIISLQETVAYIIMSFGGTISQLRARISSTERIFEIFDLEPEIEQYTVKCEGKASPDSVICFDNVNFSYQTRENVLKNININVKKGQTIALVGQSGGGKSTVIKLLLGFYQINGGGIFINGEPISDYKLKSLRENFSYVPQDASLFEGSVYENIKFADPHATDEEIYEAAKIANAHEFILSLPKGYETNVGARGENLSGGQRQRVSIARAVLKNAEILLLDEATSALDNENEAIVQQGIDNLMKGKTAVVVAHRLSTIKNADWIYVFENGEIVEEGVHDSLLDKQGVYKKLYEYFEMQ